MSNLDWLSIVFSIHIFLLMVPWFAYYDDELNDWQARLLAWYTLLTPITIFISPIILGLFSVFAIIAILLAFIGSVTIIPIGCAIDILRKKRPR